MISVYIAIGGAMVGGVFALVAVIVGWRLTHGDAIREHDRRDAVTLAQVAAGMSRMADGQRELWEVADQVRSDVAYIAGSLGVTLPARR